MENECVICGKKEFSAVEIPHFVCEECSKRHYKELEKEVQLWKSD